MDDNLIDKALLDKRVEREIEELRLAGRLYRFEPEPRCKVCRQTSILGIVNKLLAAGESYSNILRDLSPLNEELDERERITYSSIRTHANRHFNKDEAAAAVYRRILEENARKADVDFVEGVKSAVTPMAYVETVMNKGYQKLVSPEGEVSVELGLQAAMKLHGMVSEEGADIDDLIHKTNRLIEVVREVVPVSYWEEIVRRLESEEAGEPDVVDVEVEEDVESSDEFFDRTDNDNDDEDEEL